MNRLPSMPLWSYAAGFFQCPKPFSTRVDKKIDVFFFSYNSIHILFEIPRSTSANVRYVVFFSTSRRNARFLCNRKSKLTRNERRVAVSARHVHDGLNDGHYSRHPDADRILVDRVQSQLSVAVRTPNVHVAVFYRVVNKLNRALLYNSYCCTRQPPPPHRGKSRQRAGLRIPVASMGGG